LPSLTVISNANQHSKENHCADYYDSKNYFHFQNPFNLLINVRGIPDVLFGQKLNTFLQPVYCRRAGINYA